MAGFVNDLNMGLGWSIAPRIWWNLVRRSHDADRHELEFRSTAPVVGQQHVPKPLKSLGIVLCIARPLQEHCSAQGTHYIVGDAPVGLNPDDVVMLGPVKSC